MTDIYFFIVGITSGFAGGMILTSFFNSICGEKPFTPEKKEDEIVFLNELDRLYSIVENQSISIKNLSKIIVSTVAETQENNSKSQNDTAQDNFADSKDKVNSSTDENINKNKTEENSSDTISDSEILSMFVDEDNRKNRTDEEILNVGRNIPPEPINYHSKPGGGYATMKTLDDTRRKSEEFKIKKLSRADELDILNIFSKLRGENFWKGIEYAKEKDYTLHPVYINGCKNPALVYSGTVIGVSVEDDEYDYETGTLSNIATIISVVDVGGQDMFNRNRC